MLFDCNISLHGVLTHAEFAGMAVYHAFVAAWWRLGYAKGVLFSIFSGCGRIQIDSLLKLDSIFIRVR